MGTFHHDKHALHGITVIVEAAGDELFIGRCDDVVQQGVILRDADVHRGAAENPSPTREEFLAQARRFGVWPNLKRVLVPADRVLAVRRLVEE